VDEDDVRLDRRQPFIIEAERLDRFARQIGEDDVGARQQPVEDRAAFVGGQVDRDAALVAPGLGG